MLTKCLYKKLNCIWDGSVKRVLVMKGLCKLDLNQTYIYPLYMVVVRRDKRVTEICDIFHSMFYCVQVLYTTNQETPVFRDI